MLPHPNCPLRCDRRPLPGYGDGFPILLETSLDAEHAIQSITYLQARTLQWYSPPVCYMLLAGMLGPLLHHCTLIRLQFLALTQLGCCLAGWQLPRQPGEMPVHVCLTCMAQLFSCWPRCSPICPGSSLLAHHHQF